MNMIVRFVFIYFLILYRIKSKYNLTIFRIENIDFVVSI